MSIKHGIMVIAEAWWFFFKEVYRDAVREVRYRTSRRA